MKAKTIALAITYASLYSALSLFLSPISFGAFQVRIAGMMLGVVPLLGIGGVIGQTLGCIVTNTFSPLGFVDLLNAIPTFAMTLVLWKLRNKSVTLGLISYSLVTATTVSLTISYTANIPFFVVYPGLIIGQVIACVVGGTLVYKALRRANLSRFL